MLNAWCMRARPKLTEISRVSRSMRRWAASLFVSFVVCACRVGVTQVYPVTKKADVDSAPHAVIVPASGDLREGSALVLARVDGRDVAFVADEDEGAVHSLDLDAGIELARTPVAGRPTQLLVVDGGLAVALRDAASVVVFIEATSCSRLATGWSNKCRGGVERASL